MEHHKLIIVHISLVETSWNIKTIKIWTDYFYVDSVQD